MPEDPRIWPLIGQDVKRTSHNVGLRNPLTDTKRRGLEFSPTIQLSARLYTGIIRAGIANAFEENFSVASPFINEPIFVLLDFARNEEVLARPARTLFECSVVVDDSILEPGRRQLKHAQLCHEQTGVFLGINLSVWKAITEGYWKIVRLVVFCKRRKLVRYLVSEYGVLARRKAGCRARSKS